MVDSKFQTLICHFFVEFSSTIWNFVFYGLPLKLSFLTQKILCCNDFIIIIIINEYIEENLQGYVTHPKNDDMFGR